jgi:ubiquinone/menaquinone biosynthesis C-methylase UbiE
MPVPIALCACAVTEPHASAPGPHHPAAAAFDRLSGRYEQLCENEIFEWMRARVHAVCLQRFPAESRVLELGCGIGIDTAFLAGRGVHVTAVDPAPGMIRQAQTRVQALSPSGRVQFFVAGLEDVERALPSDSIAAAPFDGIFSNFGALNCVGDLDLIAGVIRRLLAPGGSVVLCFMARVCPLEIAYFVSRLRPRDALRRFGNPAIVCVEGIDVPTFYHAAGDVMRALGSEFVLRALTGLGVIVPPPWLAGRWLAIPPGARRAVMAADTRVASHFPFNHVGDHFLMDVVRR